MLGPLKTYLTKGVTFFAIEVYQINETISFQVLEIKRKKGQLEIVDSQTINTLDFLTNRAKNATPIYLVYNASDVLTKSLDLQSNLSGRAALENKFPGLNLDSFFFQVSKINNRSVISVVKKNAVTTHIDQLQELKFNVVGFSLGPSSLSTIIDYLNKDVIVTNTEEIHLNHDSDESISITKIENRPPSTYTINGLNIEGASLLSFSGILNFVFNKNDYDSNYGDTIQALQKTFENKRAFHLILSSSLVFILMILLSNFLIFNFYFNKTQSLKDNLSFSDSNKNRLMLMQQKVADKEKKVDAVLSVSNSKSSFYLDKLGASIPSSILLTDMLYQPFKKPIQESKPIELQKHIIWVLGVSNDNEEFSSWITKLEEMKWVNSIETKDFDYINKGSSSFKIKINAEEL